MRELHEEVRVALKRRNIHPHAFYVEGDTTERRKTSPQDTTGRIISPNMTQWVLGLQEEILALLIERGIAQPNDIQDRHNVVVERVAVERPEEDQQREGDSEPEVPPVFEEIEDGAVAMWDDSESDQDSQRGPDGYVTT